MLTLNIILLFLCVTTYGLARVSMSTSNFVIPVEAKPYCPGSSDKASIFIANNVQLQSKFYGAVSPANTCTTCPNGKANYYDSAAEDEPHGTPPLEAIGSIAAVNCTNMCICDTAGDCYTPTGYDVVITFWPYCSDGKCGTYVQIRANSDSSGFVSTTTGSLTFTAGAQVAPNYDFKPFTDPSYIYAATVSCEGCVASSCRTTSS
uniref:Uncharacterized protein n=1 Tax=Panagrellus redivivus TaxID=6233 RepID=A0A7E4W113_PANRE